MLTRSGDGTAIPDGVGVILAEEFYWFSLMMVRVGSTSFARRFVLQVLSLLTGCVLLYAAFALFSTGGFQPNVRFFARNAGVVGVAYAVSLLLWSMLLLQEPEATAARKALASIVASAMLAGTFYMAVAASVRREAQTDIQNVSDAGPQVVPTVPASIAPAPTRITPAPSGITVPSPLRVSIPPTPTRVMSAPPPAGIVLRLGEKPLRLRQPNWAECGLGPAQAKPEEDGRGEHDECTMHKRPLDGKRHPFNTTKSNAVEAVEAPRCDLCHSSQAGIYG